MITVLGKLKDTQRYAGQAGYNVLPFSLDWTPEKNRRWLQSAIERGDDFLIISTDVSGQFAEELQYLAEHNTRGYALDLSGGQALRTARTRLVPCPP